MYRKMTNSQGDINKTNYHEYYYHVIDKNNYDDYYIETIDINEPDKLDLLDPDGTRIGINYNRKGNVKEYHRYGFDRYLSHVNRTRYNINNVKLYFTGNEELDNKLKDLNIELYKIENMEDLKKKWDNIKEDSTFQGLKDTSNKNPHSTHMILDFGNLNDTNVGKILCHIATIPTYNIFMTKMKNIDINHEEGFKNLFNEFEKYTQELKIDHPANDLVNKLSRMIRKNYTGWNAGKRKTRRNRKSKKGKKSRKARKSRRKSNRRHR